MLTLPGVLVSAELSIARGAHVLSIVLSISVRALGDSHHSGSLVIIFARLFSSFMMAAVLRIMFLLLFFGNLLLRNVQDFNLLALSSVLDRNYGFRRLIGNFG